MASVLLSHTPGRADALFVCIRVARATIGDRAPIDGFVWHLDVDSSHPAAGKGSKGSAVRRRKWYVNWV